MNLKLLLVTPFEQDLKQQRNLSLDIAEDADYRLEIQSSASQVFFAYLPADAELQLTNPLDANLPVPPTKGSLETEKRPLDGSIEPEQKRMKTEVENNNLSAPPTS